MNRATFCWIFFLLCLFCIHDFANAQEDTTKLSFLEMSLEELLNQEVVTASKISVKSSDAPATIHLVTEDQIKTRGYSNLEQVLEDIPGIEIQRKASVEYSNYFTLRGIDGSEKFIIMMDGMRINSPTGTPLAVVYNYPVINAKQIEIILGPASALYGVDAFTGVINIITKNGQEAEGVMLSGSYGNFNTTNNSFMAGVGNEDISFVLTGNFYFSEEPFFPDIYKDEYSWYNQHYKTKGEMLVSPWDPTIVTLPVKDYETPTTSYAVHAKLNFRNFEVGYFRNFESHSSSISTLPEYSVYSKEASFKYLVESFYTSYNYVSNNNRWELKTILSHSRDEVDPRSLYTNNYTSYINGYKYAFNRSLKIEQQATFLLSDENTFIAGISYEDITALPKTGDMPFQFDRNLAADFQDIYYLGTNITDKDGNDLTISQDFYYLQYQNLGTFLQWRSALTHKLSLTMGGRLDFNTRYRTTINPRVGLVYGPAENLRIKVLYGRAYLSPSPYRQYQHYGSFQPVVDSVSGEITGLQSGYWRLPGKDLESQKISTYEARVSYIITSNLILSINGFFNDVDDILSREYYSGQTFKGVPVTTIERPVNEGHTTSYGGTARMDFKNTWQTFTLNSFLAYTFIDGEIDGVQIPYTAQSTVKAVTDLNFNRFSASARFIYRSRSYHRTIRDDTGNLVSNDPYGVINLSARYELVNRERSETEVFVKISNLLNSKHYNVPLGGDESIRMVPQDPIRFLLGIQIQFH